ncbi:hypothetical protein N4R57_07610 [Rhodobacteraceae bacterium D3-12]|nr:hypothetical protein N4R57_07610 [Rhodobacteraceae bacterium D3-12]
MLHDQSLVTKLVWASLLVVAVGALIELRFSLAFVASATLVLSLAPALVAGWADIRVPPSFMLAVVLFVGATLFLGEVFDFYERFWWWDILLHGGSAVGFGLIGFILVFMMFQGDRFAAPAGAIAFFAFCFAIAIGASWEVFEFAMDQLFGFNMQKSGLMDTMGDLIVDMVGAVLGAGAGWLYLKGREHAGLPRLIGDFVERNPRFFRRLRKQARRHGED